MVRGLTVTDECGTIGSAFSTETMALPIGALSTISHDIPVGSKLRDFPFAARVTKALDLKDLACPTWGLSGPWTPPDHKFDPNLQPDTMIPGTPVGGTHIVAEVAPNDTIIGPPWFPIIVMPQEILDLDPQWAKCKGPGQFDDAMLPVFDPPRALTAEAAMAGAGAPPAAPTPPLALIASASVAQPAAEIAPSDSSSPTIAATVPTGKPALEDSSGAFHPANPMGVDPASSNKNADPASPANADPVSSTSSNQAQDPQVAAANAGGSPTATANPPASAAADQNPHLTGMASKLEAALAVSTSPAAVPAPASSPAANPPAANQPVGNQQTANDPATNQQPATDQPAANNLASSPAQNSPVAVTPTENTGSGNQPAAINSPEGSAPVSSSPPGIGAQIIKPFTPVTTSQVVVSLVPVAASPGAQPPPDASPAPASDPSNNSNSPSEPSNGNSASGSFRGSPQPGLSNGNHASETSNDSNPSPADQPNPISASELLPNSNAPSSNPSFTSNNSPAVQAPAPPVLSFQGSNYAPNSASAYIIASHTLLPGVQVTISNAPPISLASDGSLAVIGSSTQQLQAQPYDQNSPQKPPLVAPPVIKFGSSSYSQGSSSVFIIASSTLTPGGQITVSGTPISLAPDRGNVVIGSSTQQLQSQTPSSNTPPSFAASTPTPSPEPSALSLSTPALVFGGSTYQRLSSLDYVIASQTLTPGAQVTVSNTPISLASDGGHAVVGSSTQNLVPVASPTGGNGTAGAQPYHSAGGRIGVWRVGLVVWTIGAGFLCII